MKNLITLFFGSFLSLSMAPINFWPILFISLSYIYINITKSKTPFDASLSGFIFSLGYFGFSLAWVGNALLIEDNPYYWAWPFAVSGLPIVLSLFTAIGCYAYKRLYKDINNVASYIGFVTCLFISEYARGHLLTGFPWNLYGYSWIDILPIAQTASISSIYLLTLITIFWACSPGFLIISQHKKNHKLIFSAIISVSIISAYMYGVYRINANPIKYHDNYNIVVIQPNIKQSEKWKPENRAKNFKKQLNLSYYRASKADNLNADSSKPSIHYIIWPETAMSQDVIDTPWARNNIKHMLSSYDGEAYLITGALRYNGEQEEYYNSIIVFNDNAEIINTYDKHHLVPFGEYMPFDDILNISPIVGFSGFKEGSNHHAFKTPEGLNFLPFICYEVIFPIISNIKTTPDVLLNVTNDGWYGKSSGPYQHLVQAKFRAIESSTPLIRSANTGISAIITPLGYSILPEVLLDERVYLHKLPRRISSDSIQKNIEMTIIWFLITFCTIFLLYINIIKNSVLHRKLTEK
ncbi:MAG: apolipoprotein N-acyltransferase [Alphaproteobacteria bacterium]